MKGLARALTGNICPTLALWLAASMCVAGVSAFAWLQPRQRQLYYDDDDNDDVIGSSSEDLEVQNSIDETDEDEEESTSDADPTLRAGLFEGDIDGINLEDLDGRNAINTEDKLWPNGTIPYEFKLFAFSLFERQIIRSAIKEFEVQTCIRFKPRQTKDKDYIRFVKGKGCYSHVGRVGGPQDVSVGDGCAAKGIIMHEMNHAVGFWHEQSRPDRDNYVVIRWENIQKGTEENFAKYPVSIVQNLNESYDYNSLMHYGPNSFARRKYQKTIEPKIRVRGLRMGQRIGFTSIDLRKINKLYNCTAAAAAAVNESQPAIRHETNIIGDIFTDAANFIQAIIDQLQR